MLYAFGIVVVSTKFGVKFNVRIEQIGCPRVRVQGEKEAVTTLG